MEAINRIQLHGSYKRVRLFVCLHVVVLCVSNTMKNPAPFTWCVFFLFSVCV